MEINLTPVEQTQPFPQGEYEDVAWLPDNQIAFIYRPASQVESYNLSDDQLILYDLNTQNWRELAVPQGACPLKWLTSIDRLPDDNLGILYRCDVGDVLTTGTILYEWERQSDTFHILRSYPGTFDAAGYAFSPDMSRLLQEESPSLGMRHHFYWAKEDNSLEQILSDYQRVHQPRWSPDGTTIAFIGTQIYSGTPPTQAITFKELESLLLYPWDLYLMDADGANARVILPDLLNTGKLQWVPESAYLSFAGEVEHEMGIWAFEPNTQVLIKLWSSFAYYDWSPDGKYLIMLPRSDKETDKLNQPVIFITPSELFENQNTLK